MSLSSLFYLTPTAAKAAGYTHTGRAYGIPAYFHDHPWDGDQLALATKVRPLIVFVGLADALYGTAAGLILWATGGDEMHAPITVTGPIP